MHIHGNQMNRNEVGQQPFAAIEKVASAQRAAETRKKLIQGGWMGEDVSDTEATFMIVQWTEDSAQSSRHRGSSRSPAKAFSNERLRSPVEEDDGMTPISVWV
jgi:hypothetical protein